MFRITGDNRLILFGGYNNKDLKCSKLTVSELINNDRNNDQN
jgi:hypothetical protein